MKTNSVAAEAEAVHVARELELAHGTHNVNFNESNTIQKTELRANSWTSKFQFKVTRVYESNT